MSEVNHAERGHSEIGASSSKRWLNCPASVGLSRGLPNPTSPYAAEGTAAHELGELCLENGTRADEYLGKEINGFEVTEEMARCVNFYLDKLAPYISDDTEYDFYVEEKFELPDIHPNMYGSNDFCAVKDGELVISDYKHGAGLNVDAEGNTQLIIYALGAYEEFNPIYNIKKVKLSVCQPRIEGQEWSEWNITADELLEYKEMLKEGVAQVYSKTPKMESGDHCRFCLAKYKCPKLKEEAEDLIQSSFDDLPVEKKQDFLPDPSELSDDQIIKILKNSKKIEDFFKAVHSHAHNLVEKGHSLEGYKLVKARTQRKIRDKGEFIAQFEPTFGDDLYQKELLTLGKLEKLIGKKEVDEYCIKPDKGNQLAPISDKRPEVKPVIDQAFDEAEEEINFKDMEF